MCFTCRCVGAPSPPRGVAIAALCSRVQCGGFRGSFHHTIPPPPLSFTAPPLQCPPPSQNVYEVRVRSEGPPLFAWRVHRTRKDFDALHRSVGAVHVFSVGILRSSWICVAPMKRWRCWVAPAPTPPPPHRPPPTAPPSSTPGYCPRGKIVCIVVRGAAIERGCISCSYVLSRTWVAGIAPTPSHLLHSHPTHVGVCNVMNGGRRERPGSCGIPSPCGSVAAPSAFGMTWTQLHGPGWTPCSPVHP